MPGPHVLAELATPVIAVIATPVIAGLDPAIFFNFLNFFLQFLYKNLQVCLFI